MATHTLHSTERSISPGVLDPRRPPALTIGSGDEVICPNTWTQWGDQARFGMSFAEREPLRRRFPTGPYSNLGPVVVRGAEPGDVLECEMLRTYPIDWGGTRSRSAWAHCPPISRSPTCTTSGLTRRGLTPSSSMASGFR
jgi:acetamidase/formamidase